MAKFKCDVDIYERPDNFPEEPSTKLTSFTIVINAASAELAEEVVDKIIDPNFPGFYDIETTPVAEES